MNYRIDFIDTDSNLIGSLPTAREDLKELIRLNSFEKIKVDGKLVELVEVCLNFDTVEKTVIVQAFVR